jgi:SAM-dependent methyltransferase
MTNTKDSLESSFSRKIYYSVMESIDWILGRQNPLLPPRRLRVRVGNWKDFKTIGEEFLKYFIELGGLKPTESVLDVGCGIGRMAIPLTRYLDKKGNYEGFDVLAEGIRWATTHITPKFPNFHFQHFDLYNQRYNPNGKLRSNEFVFPYENDSFDFVFLISIFTHMLPEDLENYLSEISRVLKTDGRCLITFFLLNSVSKKLIEANLSHSDFRYKKDCYRIVDKNHPERAIAYDENFVRMLYKKHSLTLVEPIHYGSWSGRTDHLSFQDIIIANK